jgi:hypothetical protein
MNKLILLAILWAPLAALAGTAVDSAKADSTAEVAKLPDEADAGGGAFTCTGKSTCGQMTTCAEAEFYLKQCGKSRLDRDHDGIPCESICQ